MDKKLVILDISSEQDIILAKKVGKEQANELGFHEADQARIVTAISELARNIFLYAKRGQIHIHRVARGRRVGLAIKSIDSGPGIACISSAMLDGYSTSGGLGSGISGAKRLMDEFEIKSEPGHGTEITIIKWIKQKSTPYNQYPIM